MFCIHTAGGAATQRAVGGAVQGGTRGRGGEGGSSTPGGGAEAGDAEDGKERVPGKGTGSNINLLYQKRLNIYIPKSMMRVNI